MSIRSCRIISCKNKTSSSYSIGFPNGSNIGSTVKCRGETHRYTVHLHQSSCRDTKLKDKRHIMSLGYKSICNIGSIRLIG